MLEVEVKGIKLYLQTQPGLFSPNAPDRGTVHMLQHVEFAQEDIVLDLGCGYGLVGIYAASIIPSTHVYMTDIDPEAVAAAAVNLEVNGISGVTVVHGSAYDSVDRSDFTLILSNPPYHTDFAVAKTFIEKGFNRLCVGGHMYMVTKRKEWYKNKFISVFGGVRIWEEDGYYIFMAQKKSSSYAHGSPHTVKRK